MPASYSGFETCVENLGKRLAARGHHVIVYCRRQRGKPPLKQYLGMQLVTLPAVRTKGLETMSHSALSTIHSLMFARPDAVIIFGVGNAIFSRLLHLGQIPSAINVDGADWLRLKWGSFARTYLRLSKRIATSSSSVLIADSHAVAEAYCAAGDRTVFIPYGSEVPRDVGVDTLLRFGLRPRSYFLAVGRLVPENGFHHLLRAYKQIASPFPLVIVGDAPYAEDYKRRLRELAPPNTIFTGYQFGSAYHELSRSAYAFLFAAEVGGTHPVLIEQLAHGNCVLARTTDSNVEVLGNAGMLFRNEEELVQGMALLVNSPEVVASFRRQARARALLYSWDEVTDSYERLLDSMVARKTVRSGER